MWAIIHRKKELGDVGTRYRMAARKAGKAVK
jgi:hypothetical protein